MNKLNLITKIFLVLVGLAFLNVAIQAFINPQAVMDFVEVTLNTISAKNSIRAYYGGVNLAIALFLIYGAFKMQQEALIIASLYGGGFVIGRLYSIVIEDMPNKFILTWLCIESVLTIVSLWLLFLRRSNANKIDLNANNEKI